MFHLKTCDKQIHPWVDIDLKELVILERFFFSAMASVVLAASNHNCLASSIWSTWAGAPYDLLLFAEVNMKDDKILMFCQLSQDGKIEAHCGMLLPLSRHLTAAVETLPYTGFTEVFLQDQ